MFKRQSISPQIVYRLIDFIVLGVAFYVSCMLLLVDPGTDLIVQILVYSTVLLIPVRVCKSIVVRYKHFVGEITWQILGNATGILVGTIVILLLENLFPVGGEYIAATVFSGFMAFFILGTLLPLIHKKTSPL